ncbi:CU044_2847 family protein [Streptomyces prasinopilosus]|uniref:Trypsin-co-occurring domain-containing protein n=1 Tax=Streptomyces prasinopilosus TaxID=67344 RepID=A0A1G6M763_9ACTN|nr:CU044_2847 family protein [Streptomyces prasinopilosus]SDC50775.1 hypothetical protein SAMN05216505_102383 [Streptomyces prasinopilosus]
MTEYIKFDLEDGGQVLVQPAAGSGVQLTSRTGDAVNRASAAFGSALAGVRKAANEALAEFRRMAEGPESIEIEFGVVLNAESGAVIAKTGMEGHLKVTLSWRRTESA